MGRVGPPSAANIVETHSDGLTATTSAWSACQRLDCHVSIQERHETEALVKLAKSKPGLAKTTLHEAKMSDSQPQLLDALQTELNRVLEQTGRLFAAVNSNGKAVPTAQASKLKQMLPSATSRFHEALDQLEDELQTAKLVMRRDLALCRERACIQNPNAINGTAASDNVNKNIGDVAEAKAVDISIDVPDQHPSEPEATKTAANVPVQDSQPSEPVKTDATTQPANEDKKPDESLKGGDNEEDVKAVDVSDQVADPASDEKPSEAALQINTRAPHEEQKVNGEQPADENKEPDTGTFSNANDLDSLFGGPTSAGVGDGQDFDMDPNNNTEFDFGFDTNIDSNAADNDNNDISALLPGLQDYANTQPTSGDPDFDTMLNDIPIDQNDQQHVSGENRDSTFDDLMDLTNFNTEFGAASGDGGTNENRDFDFSFDS